MKAKLKKANTVKRARFRVLPLVICLSAVIFTLKIETLWENTKPNAKPTPILSLAATAQAQNSEVKDNKSEESAPSQPTEARDAFPSSSMSSYNMQDPDDRMYSDAELEVLQNLSRRREEIEAQERELEMKIATLNAAEMQIDAKIKRLEELQEEINRLVSIYDKGEQEKLESLVKIYSNMKPKDAARIFNDLEMDILIKLFSQMKDAKAASILSVMDPEKANALTVELANKNKPDFMKNN